MAAAKNTVSMIGGVGACITSSSPDGFSLSFSWHVEYMMATPASAITAPIISNLSGLCLEKN
jgi:hypothetical protein